jgi:protein-ribulosamine 3-kinase
MLPDTLKRDIESRLGDAIEQVHAVAGGCISNASRVRTRSGGAYFLKWGDNPGMFHAEAQALEVIRATQTVRVPAVVALGDWLVTEWIEPAPMTRTAWEKLGGQLAEMHRHQSPQFGWQASNYIGSLPQSNSWSADWTEFWRDQRIIPQIEGLGTAHRQRVDKLLLHAADELAAGNHEGASLLHGDLWGGNIHGAEHGDAAVIDPSSYYGHREVDLAMAALFGGFDPCFYEAYNAAWPLERGYDRRRLFYQLYYMLVHVNLFGGAYLSGTMSLVGKLGF